MRVHPSDNVKHDKEYTYFLLSYLFNIPIKCESNFFMGQIPKILIMNSNKNKKYMYYTISFNKLILVVPKVFPILKPTCTCQRYKSRYSYRYVTCNYTVVKILTIYSCFPCKESAIILPLPSVWRNLITAFSFQR